MLTGHEFQLVTGHAWNTFHHSVPLQLLYLLLMYWSDATMDVSGPSSTAFTPPFFMMLSPNQVPNFNKTQINTNWDWYERLLSNPQVYLNNLPSAIIVFKKIDNKRGEEHHVTTQEGFMTNRSFKCSPYLWMNTAGAQKITKKKRQSNTHAHAMQYLKVSLVACQVWSKVKLLHMLFGGFLNHVRQALSALPKIKHVLYYNVMQETTQAHIFSEVTKVKHIELIPQPTKCSLN